MITLIRWLLETWHRHRIFKELRVEQRPVRGMLLEGEPALIRAAAQNMIDNRHEIKSRLTTKERDIVRLTTRERKALKIIAPKTSIWENKIFISLFLALDAGLFLTALVLVSYFTSY